MKILSDVCVYTNDLRLFFCITQKFKSEDVAFNALNNFESIHPSAKVLITTQQDLDLFDPDIPEQVDIIVVLPGYSVNEILLRTCQHLNNIPTARQITVSIDPGTVKTGLAVFLDENLIFSKEFSSFEQVESYVQEIFLIFPNPFKYIKIGNGYNKLANFYLKLLSDKRKFDDSIKYLLINERFTSKQSQWKKKGYNSIHERAAILIGRRKGELITLECL